MGSRAGGQGLYLRSLNHLGRSGEAKDCKNQKKVKCDGWTDRRTDGPTDGPTKRVVESRRTRLKIHIRIRKIAEKFTFEYVRAGLILVIFLTEPVGLATRNLTEPESKTMSPVKMSC